MSPVAGIRSLANILRLPPHGVKKLPADKPATLFQSLWLKRTDLEQKLAEKNRGLEELKTQHQPLTEKAGQAQEAVRAQETAFRQAKAAVEANSETHESTSANLADILQRIQTAATALKAANTAVNQLNAALSCFAPEGAAEKLTHAEEQVKVIAATEERDAFQTKITALSSHIKSAEAHVKELQASVAALESNNQDLIIVKERAEGSLQRAREQHGLIAREQEALRTLTAGHEREKDEIRTAIDRIDKQLEGQPAAIRLVMIGETAVLAYPAETRENFSALIETQRIVSEELLPILREESTLHGNGTRLEQIIAQKIQAGRKAIADQARESASDIMEKISGFSSILPQAEKNNPGLIDRPSNELQRIAGAIREILVILRTAQETAQDPQLFSNRINQFNTALGNLEAAIRTQGNPVAMALLEEERLLQASPEIKQAMAALTGNGAVRLSPAEVISVLAFLAERIPIWERLVDTRPNDTEADPRLATLKTIKARLEFAQAMADAKGTESSLAAQATGTTQIDLGYNPETQPLGVLQRDLALLTQSLASAWEPLGRKYPGSKDIGLLIQARQEREQVLSTALQERKNALDTVKREVERINQHDPAGEHGPILTRIMDYAEAKDRGSLESYRLELLQACLEPLQARADLWEATNHQLSIDHPFDQRVVSAKAAVDLATVVVRERRAAIQAAGEAANTEELSAWPTRGSHEHVRAALVYSRAREEKATAGLLATHHKLEELEFALPFLEASVRVWTEAQRQINTVARADDPFKAKVERKVKALALVRATIAEIKPKAPQGDFQGFAGGAEGDIRSPDESFFGRTSIGTRKNQEDAAFYYKDQKREVLGGLDGAGGHAAGEVASRLATETFHDSAAGLAAGLPIETILERAHANIQAEAKRDPAKSEMASTAAVAEIQGGRFKAANVGDSRVYHLKGPLWQIPEEEKLVLVSQDHNLAVVLNSGELFGVNPPLSGQALKTHYEETRKSQHSNVVTKILGRENMEGAHAGDRPAQPYVSPEYEYREGDMLLVVTDGHEYLPFDEFRSILDPSKRPEQLTKELHDAIFAAMEGRGGDNITVLVHKQTGKARANGLVGKPGENKQPGLFASLTKPELERLYMPASGNGHTDVTDTTGFNTYVQAYLKDPLACVQAENQALAKYYLSLIAQTKKTGLLRRAALSLEQVEARFDAALKSALAARVKIEAALFPNGKGRDLTAADINDPKKYQEATDSTYLYHNAAIPAVIDAELGIPTPGEIGVINKGQTDSQGNPAKIFEFMFASKQIAVLKIAIGQIRPVDNVNLARDLFILLNNTYSSNQQPEETELEGQAMTQNYFMNKGGCCRHRSIALQLGYQEAGIPSTTYLGYADKSERIPGMLGGPHMWVMLDPMKNNSWGYLADPNRSFDSANPNARFFGQATETRDQAWTAPKDFFDGNTKIFSTVSKSSTYRKLTAQVRGIDIDYYVAQERFNFLWRPLLGIEIA